MDLHKIKQMVEDGFATRKIARDLNLNFDHIKKIIDTEKYSLLKEDFSEVKINKIIDLYRQGISAKQLGFKFGIDKRRIQKWVADSGCLRTLEESHRLKFINEHIFDIIDEQDKAYWLGFLYADAYNNETKGLINLCLKRDDSDHIRKYIKFLNGDEKDISFGVIKSESKDYHTCSYKVNSRYLSSQLKKIGCPQAKSFIIKFPDWLNPELHSHFIRGYFDGDGSIKMSEKTKEWRINICGTKELNYSIGSILNTLNINCSYEYISKTENNTWVLVISGNEQVKNFCQWMYCDAKTYLNRKYERYLKLCNQQNNRKFLKSTDRKTYFIKKP
jgi:intein/homing endonuclease